MKNNITLLKSVKKQVVDLSTWEEYDVKSIFTLKASKNREATKYKQGATRFVASGSTNNGVQKYVNANNEVLDKGGCLTFSTIDCSCFYQEKDYLGRGHGALIEIRHDKLTANIGLFLCTIFKQLSHKYDYNNQCWMYKLEKEKIKLPTIKTEEGISVPDWEYMENYIDSIKTQLRLNKLLELFAKIKKQCITSTNVSNWGEFYLKDLFTIKGSKTTPKQTLLKSGVGCYPYITTKASNHGVDGYYNIFTESGNCLTVDSAVLGTCFYQEKQFSASDHVELLIPKFAKFNKHHGLFIETVITITNNGVYSYAHKCNQTRIKETKIKLPSITIDEKIQPDWDLIEQHIKTIEADLFN